MWENNKYRNFTYFSYDINKLKKIYINRLNNSPSKITLYKCTEDTPKILFSQDLNNLVLIELLANEWVVIMKKFLVILFLILTYISSIASQNYCNKDIFYQYIENKENKEISLDMIKQSCYFNDYEIQLEKIIFILEENIKNFNNPYFVAKKIILNKNNEIEIIKISEYRLVYEPNHPLAQENGIECGYVRYYSSDIKTDKYWLDFYLKIRSLFKER